MTKTNENEEARTWHHDRCGALEARNRTLTITSSLCLVIAALAIVAFVSLLPLKERSLHVITVDKVTGETSVIEVKDDGAYTQIEILKRHWVKEYVIARMTYDPQQFQRHYRIVRAFAAPDVFDQYHEEYDPNNPEGLFQKYGRKTHIQTTIKTFSFLDDERVMVTLDTQRREGKRVYQRRHYTATMSIRYTLMSESEAIQSINPLGFQITQWHLDLQSNPKEEIAHENN